MDWVRTGLLALGRAASPAPAKTTQDPFAVFALSGALSLSGVLSSSCTISSVREASTYKAPGEPKPVFYVRAKDRRPGGGAEASLSRREMDVGGRSCPGLCQAGFARPRLLASSWRDKALAP